ncbi:Cytochrome P450 [Nocardioides exalbidus]|uniref:Cytochrome P450 n=1 Tax=Nocardioides exalbidus TaxID=402596 RepID=A0A1H4LNU3_9ACTN|nr:cytochrome P450 [Nocardioides exalbidus]SEB72297.1 Cytochrome P450 [Nocardioides exalbidus]
MHLDSVESAGGRLGAVLSTPRSGFVRLSPGGPWLATTPELVRQVLATPSDFDFPGDVSRSGDLSGSVGDTRSGHSVFAPVAPAQVAIGTEVFARQWRLALDEHDRAAPGRPYDAMELLRRPVARSTTAAVLPSVDESQRDRIGDLALAWIDALGPVIAARRPPRRWSRTRRTEEAARTALEVALDALPGRVQPAGELAALLAAGIQVPIAAGAFLIAWLAGADVPDADPTHVVWETLRLTPPTWITARVATGEVDVDGTSLPAGSLVLVSPLLLGRLDELVPGGDLAAFRPDRWHEGDRRPGAWLPFGAGPHACPGRNLGMAQLTHLAAWGQLLDISLSERATIDQSRGIAPLPCRFSVATRREVPS